ncbi:unnamed protein product [Ceratitis capitata]|uniref:(Mediterranean fruit fly) hypothetical protein n=1 Tax=Ceratitis capitata TaxID=7213 RepID=A0A811V085_CERCA|nr:unnamed protein product [Ceratitis capitata]
MLIGSVLEMHFIPKDHIPHSSNTPPPLSAFHQQPTEEGALRANGAAEKRKCCDIQTTNESCGAKLIIMNASSSSRINGQQTK